MKVHVVVTLDDGESSEFTVDDDQGTLKAITSGKLAESTSCPAEAFCTLAAVTGLGANILGDFDRIKQESNKLRSDSGD